ncbi:MAG TPA: hypothetical protein GXZ98_06610 [Firmicutes bacterium]|nr:hypothetical protein [Bacillota bacterium]
MDNSLLTQISIFGSLSIAIITIIANVITAFITKRYEYKQAVFRTVIDAAYKEYEHRSNLVKELAEKYKGKANILPFTEYLLFYSRLIPLLQKKKIQEKDMERACIERKILIDSFYEHTEKYKCREPSNTI